MCLVVRLAGAARLLIGRCGGGGRSQGVSDRAVLPWEKERVPVERTERDLRPCRITAVSPNSSNLKQEWNNIIKYHFFYSTKYLLKTPVLLYPINLNYSQTKIGRPAIFFLLNSLLSKTGCQTSLNMQVICHGILGIQILWLSKKLYITFYCSFGRNSKH